MTHFQIDFVLQKENLSSHRTVHQAMYMPSHGEFLVDFLAQQGYQTGLIFGLDDFALNGHTLNHSSSEILVICGADQHYTKEFLKTWKRIKKNYACRILIVSEPIYSPLAYYVSPERNAQRSHEQFLMAVEPDVVLYLSNYDCLEARKRLPSSLRVLQYSLADAYFLGQAIVPWKDKDPQLLWLGKPDAWQYSRAHQQSWSRKQQLDFLTQQRIYPFVGFSRQFTFRECYQVANRFRFQVQPRSGYAFHTARTVQAALCGSIPIILLHEDYQFILQIEAPFARPGKNILLGLDGQYHLLLEQLQDENYCEKIAAAVPELMQAGSIRTGLHALDKVIKSILNLPSP